MKNKNLVLTAVIYCIVFLVYNLLAFTIFKHRTSVFWLSYGFMVIAFLAQSVGMYFAFRKTDIEAIFFGVPLASFSFFYLLAETFAGAVFMIFQGVGMTITFVVQIILLALYAVVAILSVMARDTVQKIGDEVKEKVTFARSVLVDVEIILNQCVDLETKKELKKLSETIKYSDPMSNESILDIEKIIRTKVSQLRIYSDNDQLSEARKVCSELELLYLERNKKLMISK